MRFDSRRDSFDLLDRAIALHPIIREQQVTIENQRELPNSLSSQIKDAGFFRMLLPSFLGGHEFSLPHFIRVVESFAQADGSCGWCVGQGAVFPNIAQTLHPDLAQAIWGINPSAVVATGTPQNCQATQKKDGYFLKGHWRFASGIMHADWLAAMSPATTEDGDKLPFSMFLFPREQAILLDGWNVSGMRGTGSREYQLDNHFVPSNHAIPVSNFTSHDGIANGLPNSLLFACAFGSVALGIGRRALDEFNDLDQGKTPAFTNRKLLDDDLVHTGLAKAEALWSSLRGFLLDVAEESEHTFRDTAEVTEPLRQRLRLAATHAMRESVSVVDQIYELSGSDSIFQDHPIQRCFQDIHTLSQQIQGRPSHYRSVGRFILGLEPDLTSR